MNLLFFDKVLNAPSHLKLALQRCGTTKRRYVNVLRPQLESLYTDLKVPSMDELRKRKNVLHPFMIEMCADLQPWEEVYPLKCVCVSLSQLTFINKNVMSYV